MNMESNLTIRQDQAPAVVTGGELTIEEMTRQVGNIQKLMKSLMKRDEHYGVIPGTNKPTLLKPGAEKLCLMFRLAPKYEVEIREQGDHLTIISTCALYHINTGAMWGTGMGSCSTKESKYAYRKGVRVCPDCGKEAIIKGKAEYGGGWLCFGKKGGCGHKWPDGAQEIEGQSTDRTDNPDKADQYNTVLKMANKRSLVAAVLNATAASDIFTQDVEDLGPSAPEPDLTPPAPEDEPQTPPPARVASEKSNLDERKIFLAELARVYPDKAKADAWLKEQFESRALTKWGQVTVGILAAMAADLRGDVAVDDFINDGRDDDPADSFHLKGE